MRKLQRNKKNKKCYCKLKIPFIRMGFFVSIHYCHFDKSLKSDIMTILKIVPTADREL